MPRCPALRAVIRWLACPRPTVTHDHDPASHTDTEWDWDCTALCVGLLPAIGLSRVSQGQASKLTRLPACYLRNVWRGCPGRRRGDSEATVTITLVRRESSFPSPPAMLRPGWTGVISISQSVRVGGRTHDRLGECIVVRGKIETAKQHRTRSAAARAGGREGALYSLSVYP